jgi:hypothetical protein
LRAQLLDRLPEIRDLAFGDVLQVFGVFLGGLAVMRDLRFSLRAIFRGRCLSRGRDRALPLFGGDTGDFLCEGPQVGLEMLPQIGGGPIKSGANLVFE